MRAYLHFCEKNFFLASTLIVVTKCPFTKAVMVFFVFLLFVFSSPSLVAFGCRMWHLALPGSEGKFLQGDAQRKQSNPVKSER